MNATLISNGINFKFTSTDLLAGVMRTLVGSGNGIPFADYMIEQKDGAVDASEIGGLF